MVQTGEVVFVSLPPDVHGMLMKSVTEATINGEAELAVLVWGPGKSLTRSNLAFELFKGALSETAELLTTEFGELTARTRKCLLAPRPC